MHWRTVQICGGGNISKCSVSVVPQEHILSCRKILSRRENIRRSCCRMTLRQQRRIFSKNRLEFRFAKISEPRNENIEVSVMIYIREGRRDREIRIGGNSSGFGLVRELAAAVVMVKR